MKKIIMSCALFAMLSCGSTATTAVETQLDKRTEVALKGEWVLESVTYPGQQYIKLNSFFIADSKCFEGSVWKFISNNNKGQMSLDNNKCSSFSADITWYVNKNKEMVLKLLFEGEKAKHVKDGFVLRVANETATSFQLIDKVNVGGSLKDVVYQFKRK